MQVGANQVLHGLHFGCFGISELGDTHGDLRKPRPLSRAKPPRTRDDFKVSVDGPHDKRRKNAFAADTGGVLFR